MLKQSRIKNRKAVNLRNVRKDIARVLTAIARKKRKVSSSHG
jgi:ribosomal protein L29